MKHSIEIQTSLRKTPIVVITAMLLLLIGSIVFYKQRMLFIDPAWVVFNIINTKHFLFAEYRYGAFITQMFPLVSTFLHVPLKEILILYSLSFYLFYTVVLLLLIFRFRQYSLAILFALYLTCIVSDTYFWPNNEVHQGIGWMFLFLGWILHRSGKKEWISYGVGAIFAFLAIFSHFLVIAPLIYLCGFLLLNKSLEAFKPRQLIIYGGCILFIFLIKFKLGVSGWYDGPKLGNVLHLDAKSVLHAFRSAHAKSILSLFVSRYWILSLVFISGIFFLLKEKKYLLFAITCVGCLGYFLLICMTYPEAITHNNLFYMESEWMPITILMATPFVYYVLPQLKSNQINIALSVIFFIRFCYIAHSVPVFSNRVKTIERVVDILRKDHVNNAIVLKTETTNQALILDWGTPVEALFYSAMEKNSPMITFKMKDGKDSAQSKSGKFQSCFTEDDYSTLNTEYFKLDTIQPYKIWNAADVGFK